MKEFLEQLTVGVAVTVREVMAKMDRAARGIILVIDESGKLLATVTDGDIRRGLLAGVGLEDPLEVVLGLKKSVGNSEPVTAPEGTDRKFLELLMRTRVVRHLPLLDSEGRLKDIIFREEVPQGPGRSDVQAVVMAGGFGRRLKPFTRDLPKPMLEIHGRPMLEHIVRNLKASGIKRINITTHYLGDKIRGHFGDGENFGVAIEYLEEEYPLGTAGGLRRIADIGDAPVLVVNGDVLAEINYGALWAFHIDSRADLTVAVREYEVEVPFGVVECFDGVVSRIVEKPVKKFFVNAGIYLVEPSAISLIPEGEKLEMPGFIDLLIQAGRKVVGFPFAGYWRDVGRVKDYLGVQEDAIPEVSISRPNGSGTGREPAVQGIKQPIGKRNGKRVPVNMYAGSGG